jgi:cell division protease FtsH
VRNNEQLDRYLQEVKLKLAFEEMMRRPFRIVVDGAADDAQLELFSDAKWDPARSAQDGRSAKERDASEKIGTSNHDARRALIAAAIDAATTPAIRLRLKEDKAVAVVIDVPTTAWVKPVDDYFVGWATFARDGSTRSRDKATVGNDEASKKISRGHKVVGIAANPEMLLPRVLTAVADITIKIPQPTGAVVRDALRRCLQGRLPRSIDNQLVADLDFDDLVAVMRSDTTPLAAVQRMRNAVDRRNAKTPTDRYPDLETAVEYGKGREWGLALARDLVRLRSSKTPSWNAISWDAIDRGAIFFGPPGTGKGFLCGAIAKKCNIPFLKVTPADYFKGDAHLGVVLQEQRAVFQKAKSLAASNVACLLLIDELDGIPSRSSFSGASSNSRNADWWIPISNDLLFLCDQAKHDRVILCATTNRLDAIDSALLRPGRFERAIEIGPPDFFGIMNVLRFHLGDALEHEDISEIARLADGSTAAELMDIVRGARRRARDAKRPLILGDLKRQIEGEHPSAPVLLKRIAIHEASHAVTTVALSVGTLRHVTLLARGNVGGHTKTSRHDEDLMTLHEVENRIISILSAGVAESLLIGSKSTGSGGDDLSDDGVATSLLCVVYASTSLTGEFFHLSSANDALATVRGDPRLRHRVEMHLRQLEKRATALVERHLQSISAVAEELIGKRYLTGAEVVAIMQTVSGDQQTADKLIEDKRK